jgi:hypothetical protein
MLIEGREVAWQTATGFAGLLCSTGDSLSPPVTYSEAELFPFRGLP